MIRVLWILLSALLHTRSLQAASIIVTYPSSGTSIDISLGQTATITWSYSGYSASSPCTVTQYQSGNSVPIWAQTVFISASSVVSSIFTASGTYYFILYTPDGSSYRSGNFVIPETSSAPLSTGEIVGIVVGILAALILIGLLLYFRRPIIRWLFGKKKVKIAPTSPKKEYRPPQRVDDPMMLAAYPSEHGLQNQSNQSMPSMNNQNNQVSQQEEQEIPFKENDVDVSMLVEPTASDVNDSDNTPGNANSPTVNQIESDQNSNQVPIPIQHSRPRSASIAYYPPPLPLNATKRPSSAYINYPPSPYGPSPYAMPMMQPQPYYPQNYHPQMSPMYYPPPPRNLPPIQMQHNRPPPQPPSQPSRPKQPKKNVKAKVDSHR